MRCNPDSTGLYLTLQAPRTTVQRPSGTGAEGANPCCFGVYVASRRTSGASRATMQPLETRAHPDVCDGCAIRELAAQSALESSRLTASIAANSPTGPVMQTALVLVAKQTALALAVAMAPALQVAVMSTQRTLTTQAQENRRPVLFHKDDEKEMRKLLRKLHLQACYSDKAGFRKQIEHDKQTLGEIPGLEPGVDLTQEQVDALLNWKHLY